MKKIFFCREIVRIIIDNYFHNTIDSVDTLQYD